MITTESFPDFKSVARLSIQTLRKFSRALKAGLDVGTREGAGGSMPLQFLAVQLTLNQPKGKIMPPTLLIDPPDFQTF